jgi:ketosteroid isomerase-like protein
MRNDQLLEARASERAVIATHIAAIASLDVDRYMEQWNADGRLEMPYHPVVEARVLDGEEAIRRRMTTAAELMEECNLYNVKVSALEGSGEYLLEYLGSGRMRGAGAYSNSYCVVAKIVSGKISLWREYFNPSARSEALSK